MQAAGVVAQAPPAGVQPAELAEQCGPSGSAAARTPLAARWLVLPQPAGSQKGGRKARLLQLHSSIGRDDQPRHRKGWTAVEPLAPTMRAQGVGGVGEVAIEGACARRFLEPCRSFLRLRCWWHRSCSAV